MRGQRSKQPTHSGADGPNWTLWAAKSISPRANGIKDTPASVRRVVNCMCNCARFHWEIYCVSVNKCRGRSGFVLRNNAKGIHFAE
jgi:hypothetical protein